MLTERNLVVSRPYLGGMLRVYRYPCGRGIVIMSGPADTALTVTVVKDVSLCGTKYTIDKESFIAGIADSCSSESEANEFLRMAEGFFRTGCFVSGVFL